MYTYIYPCASCSTVCRRDCMLLLSVVRCCCCFEFHNESIVSSHSNGQRATQCCHTWPFCRATKQFMHTYKHVYCLPYAHVLQINPLHANSICCMLFVCGNCHKMLRHCSLHALVCRVVNCARPIDAVKWFHLDLKRQTSTVQRCYSGDCSSGSGNSKNNIH